MPLFRSLAVAATAALLAASTAQAGPVGLKVEGFRTPESVATDGTWYYVSNMGELKPTEKDGDGYISRLRFDGTVEELHYLPKDDGFIDSPKGLIVAGGILYAADVDRVVGFDLVSREQVFELSLAAEGTKFLNGFARKDDTTLFLSSSDTGKIFTITIGGKPAYAVAAEGINGPNGLAWDGAAQRLYVVGWGSGKPDGPVGYVDFSGDDRSFHQLGTYVGLLDGLAMKNARTLVFTDWVDFQKVGGLRTMDVTTGEVKLMELPEAVFGPADFLLAKDGRYWVPMMGEGKVLVTK